MRQLRLKFGSKDAHRLASHQLEKPAVHQGMFISSSSSSIHESISEKSSPSSRDTATLFKVPNYHTTSPDNDEEELYHREVVVGAVGGRLMEEINFSSTTLTSPTSSTTVTTLHSNSSTTDNSNVMPPSIPSSPSPLSTETLLISNNTAPPLRDSQVFGKLDAERMKKEESPQDEANEGPYEFNAPTPPDVAQLAAEGSLGPQLSAIFTRALSLQLHLLPPHNRVYHCLHDNKHEFLSLAQPHHPHHLSAKHSKAIARKTAA